jgi:hypothetical protein
MIKNTENEVALKWAIPHRQAPPYIKIDGTDRAYSPAYQWNIAMIWVDEQDVDRLLKHREKICNCNNGTYRFAFAEASQLDVNLWKTGNREGISQ